MTFRWGTVTAVSPLRVRLDGDSAALPFTPESLVDTRLLAVNDRVRCDLSNRRLLVVGRSSGLGSLGLRQVVLFPSSGTFSKGLYLWARSCRVQCVGGGGAGAGSPSTAAGQFHAGQSGGGGAYSESFIADISSLPDSVPVTVGAAGVAGAAGTAGGGGGTSSFGALVTAPGGGGGGVDGPSPAAGFYLGAGGGVIGVGDLRFAGEPATLGGGAPGGFVVSGNGGGTPLGAGANGRTIFGSSGANGIPGNAYGGGGSGSAQGPSQGTARTGGNGAAGVVRVELYA